MLGRVAPNEKVEPGAACLGVEANAHLSNEMRPSTLHRLARYRVTEDLTKAGASQCRHWHGAVAEASPSVDNNGAMPTGHVP